jgi:hypothetical protein
MRKFSLCFLLCLLVGLLIIPQADLTASASQAANATDLVAEINGWGIGLSAALSGNTVTVTGSAAGQNVNRSLEIPENVTLDWKADYSGEVASESMLYFSGKGTVDISGGKINNSGDKSSTIEIILPVFTVGGGEVIASGN